MTWSNTGKFIRYIHGTATVINAPRTIKICIHSNVAGTLKCNPGGYVYVGAGGLIAASWNPNASQPNTATYCARTWRQNSDGSDTLIGQLCTSL
jgi:hypothetical protein